MTKTTYLATALMAGALLTIGVTQASASTTVLMDAHVPFAFRAGDTLLPEGNYIVSEDNLDEDMVLIESKDGRHSAWLFASQEKPTQIGDRPELVFAKYGNERYLRDIWTLDDGMTFPETPMQLKAANEHRATSEKVRVPGRIKTS